MALSQRGAELLTQPRRVQVAQTPAEVIYREGKVRVLHYHPQTVQQSPIPLVIVYALVNRPYILDLLPGRSVVENLLAGGIDVYLIDWGTPDQADRWNSLNEYITGYIHRCIQSIKRLTDVSQVSLLGYCEGGTFSVIYTALRPDQVRNLALMATPVDFGSEEGLLNFWSKPEYFDVDKMVDTFGNIPPWLLNSTFAMLKPLENTFDKYIRFGWSLGNQTANDASVELFLAMEKWLNDGIPHPGEAFRELIKGCYQENRLIRNEFKIGLRTVDLRRISCPVCNLIAKQDHIIPPQSSLALDQAISSRDQQDIEFPGGHVGMSVSGQARKLVWQPAVQWLQARSQ